MKTHGEIYKSKKPSKIAGQIFSVTMGSTYSCDFISLSKPVVVSKGARTVKMGEMSEKEIEAAESSDLVRFLMEDEKFDLDTMYDKVEAATPNEISFAAHVALPYIFKLRAGPGPFKVGKYYQHRQNFWYAYLVFRKLVQAGFMLDDDETDAFIDSMIDQLSDIDVTIPLFPTFQEDLRAFYMPALRNVLERAETE